MSPSRASRKPICRAIRCGTSFPDFTDAHMAEHKAWLAPHHYEAETGKIRLSVHSWLLQVGGKKILIDSCCGNNKVKPGRPFWHMLNDAVSRAACRRRRAAGGDRSGDVHASASRPCRLEYAAEGRQMGADISQCALRVLEAGRRLFLQGRRRSRRKARPSSAPSANAWCRSSNTARPIWSAAGPYRLNDFIEIDSAPGHSPGHVFFKLESKGQRAAFIGDVWHHLLQVYYPDWNFPKNSDAAQAQCQPPQGARLLRVERRAGVSRPCRLAVCGPYRGNARRLPAEFQTVIGQKP